MTPELLSKNDACTMLGCSLSTIKRLLDQKAFPAFKIGRKVVIRRMDVMTWIESLPRMAPATEQATVERLAEAAHADQHPGRRMPKPLDDGEGRTNV